MSTASPVTPPTPPPAPVSGTPGPIPDHLAWAIVSTVLGLCLCSPALITGIVAIVFSVKVNNLLNKVDLDGAQRASDTAKTWCWVTTVLAIVWLLFQVTMFAGIDYIDRIQQLQQVR